MTLDEIIDGRDAEEMTVFDIDWEDDEFIIACIAGAPYKQLAQEGAEPFEVDFMSFQDACCYYRYTWDGNKLKRAVIENADLFDDDELDSGMDTDVWSEAKDLEVFPDKVEDAFNNGEAFVEVIWEK